MKELDTDIEQRVYAWLEGPFDQETKNTIEHLLKKNPKALRDAFYQDLSFGTGGLRGIMGVGTNRVNRYTIQKATQGLANYLKKSQPTGPIKVVICHDSRNNSRFFAEEAAKVLLGNDIEVFLPPELRPTPYASFACRQTKSNAAIMITASHNPPEYNGYKVYWSDGAQVVPPHDKGIISEVREIEDISQVFLGNLQSDEYHILGSEMDDAYINALKPFQTFPEEKGSLKIIYSPLHGTGITLIPKALASWGFTDLSIVKKQETPDGNFPHAHSPNPEEKEALSLGTKELLKESADLFIATDPDADRLGVVALHEGKAIPVNGNEFAALCIYHLCKMEKLPKNAAFATTIVSTPLLSAIANSYHKPCYEVLTGFKYIGELIRLWEENGKHTFIFGAEESYGCLLGDHVRDKDAIIGSLLIAEIANHAKSEGKTLIDLLYEIYRTFGIYREKLISVKFPEEKETPEKMKRLMETLRNHPPKEILHTEVKEIEDYQSSIKTTVHNNAKEPLTLPKSNVLAFRLSDQTKFVIRPSGTEPKIKVYAMTQMSAPGSIEEGIAECDARLTHLLSYIKTELLTF